jgi:2-desacetyl-2-hydroxyethyl bacteriochlorophyllide A dehydrogenase
MRTEAIVFTAPSQPVLQAVELPDELAPDEFRGRTLCSGISIGTERLLWEGRLAWSDEPHFPQVLGYQAIGIVEALGSEVTDFEIGQRVLWRNSRFAEELPRAFSGTHTAMAVARRGDALPAPEGLDDESGSLFVLPAVGFHGVAMAQVSYGEVVAVQGLGMVGLAVVAACRLRGARLVAIDPSPQRRAAALAMGADVAVDPTIDSADDAVKSMNPSGADVVFESTGVGRLLDAAFALARTHGRFVFQGNYGGDKPIEIQFLVPHGKQLTCFFPCNDGLLPCRRAVTQLMARGQLDWRPAVSHVVGPVGAVTLYERIIAGHGAATDVLGAVIRW